MGQLSGQGQMSALGTGGGGGAGTGPFTPTPPPPPCWILAGKCQTMGAERRPKEILLELEKMGFHPMCLYSKYSVFEENPIMDENQFGPIINTTPRCVGDGPYCSG